jgi:hypothetical protein
MTTTTMFLMCSWTVSGPFGYGFFPGVLALVVWSIATSIAQYRALDEARS